MDYEETSAEYLSRIKTGLKDDVAYEVFVESIDLIRSLVDQAKAHGCRYYYGREKPKTFELQMIFAGDNGEEFRVRVRFGAKYQERAKHPIGYETRFVFSTAILNLVLNTPGIEPMRYTPRGKLI
ncbi:hypothetical protein [Acidicapsa acidisoli]|uniref:hypothetical protein n=1 Tax=Acidicapsa acidisoli TaxID=1615681 RepID=UPI0021DF5D55|nr:hypothetical protein [Acidicapsa acidisoli]